MPSGMRSPTLNGLPHLPGRHTEIVSSGILQPFDRFRWILIGLLMGLNGGRINRNKAPGGVVFDIAGAEENSPAIRAHANATDLSDLDCAI